MQKFQLFGAPGTGKTTYLLGLLEKEMKNIHPEEMAYVSFTRKGTYEGVERAKKKFELKDAQLPYFRTLHSICFREVGAHKADMVDEKHYKLFSDRIGISFSGHCSSQGVSANDIYLHAVSMEHHNKNLAFKMSQHLNEHTLNHVRFQYAAMKRQLGIKDFDDLIIEYLKDGKPLDIKTAFIDEAQDLTPLQWKLIRKMFSKAEKIYVAGDDDQAVFEWAGADVKEFLNFSKNRVILDKSYRLPSSVLSLAKGISKDIKVRIDKRFESNGTEGEIEMRSIHNMDFKGGELILARTNYRLKTLAKALEAKGLVYTLKGGSSITKYIFKAVKAYKAFSEGTATEGEVAIYKSFFSEITKGVPWYFRLKRNRSEIEYYENILDNNGLDREPIYLETFHSSKGSENDHVILDLELSKRVYEGLFENYDSELRCLYVGLTRTKRKLTLLTPEGKFTYPNRYFT